MSKPSATRVAFQYLADHGDNYMAPQSLRAIEEHARMLQDKITADTDIPDWAEAKITEANAYLRDVFEHYQHDPKVAHDKTAAPALDVMRKKVESAMLSIVLQARRAFDALGFEHWDVYATIEYSGKLLLGGKVRSEADLKKTNRVIKKLTGVDAQVWDRGDHVEFRAVGGRIGIVD